MIQRLFSRLMMVLAVACGVGSLVLFAVFPVGSHALVNVQWALPGILLWDGLLCLAFFLLLRPLPVLGLWATVLMAGTEMLRLK